MTNKLHISTKQNTAGTWDVFSNTTKLYTVSSELQADTLRDLLVENHNKSIEQDPRQGDREAVAV